MKDKGKITKSLAALLQQTQDGPLTWEAEEPPNGLSMKTDEIIDTVYISTKDGRRLKLYSFKTKCHYDEDLFNWTDGVTLKVSDESEISWWQFPHNPIIWDLLEAVRFKTVEVEGFIDGLISESEEDSDS